MRAFHEADDAGEAAAGEAARAAMGAASAAFLHPLATAAQVKHILGSRLPMAWLIADGTRLSRIAAERKLPVSATVAKTRI